MVYRLNVGTFTGEANDVDDVSHGTFLGVLKKVPHLRRLGGCIYSLVFKVLDIMTGMWAFLLRSRFLAHVQCVFF